MNRRVCLASACIAMFIAVAAGAFGAHALKSTLAPERLAVWHTAVQYQAWHALALLAIGALSARAMDPRSRRWLHAAAWLFIAGILLFSGSLYLLALTGERWLGALTPFGGIALLLAWLALLRSVGFEQR